VKIQLKSGGVSVLDQGTGPAILLLHAFPLHHAMWEPQLSLLSSRFRVIVPDIRGFGQSQPASPWTMEEMADDLNELLDRLNIESCVVAGVSMGGYIALPFWSKYAQRVNKLILANTRARADNETEKRARDEMIAAIQQHGAGILPDRMLPRLLMPNASPDVVRTVRTMIEQAEASAAAYAVMAMRDRSDFSATLHKVKCPALVVTGEKDVIIRLEDSRDMAAAIPGARFVAIPESGHLSNLENPKEFNRVLLEFLD
jgi:pimeloyl-ACP methyl ester carboxylesterase